MPHREGLSSGYTGRHRVWYTSIQILKTFLLQQNPCVTAAGGNPLPDSRINIAFPSYFLNFSSFLLSRGLRCLHSHILGERALTSTDPSPGWKATNQLGFWSQIECLIVDPPRKKGDRFQARASGPESFPLSLLLSLFLSSL